VEINSKGLLIAEATTHILSHYRATMHNVQPPDVAIHKPRYGTLVQGSTNPHIQEYITNQRQHVLHLLYGDYVCLVVW
jgi:hypothetical protein